MLLRYSLSQQDYEAALAFAEKSMTSIIGTPSLQNFLAVAFWISVVVGLFTIIGGYLDRSTYGAFFWLSLSGFVALAALLAHNKLRERNILRHHMSVHGPFPKEQTLELGESGIRLTDSGGEVFFPWESMVTVHESATRLFVATRLPAVIAIPRDAFVDEASQAEVLDVLRKRTRA